VIRPSEILSYTFAGVAAAMAVAHQTVQGWFAGLVPPMTLIAQTGATDAVAQTGIYGAILASVATTISVAVRMYFEDRRDSRHAKLAALESELTEAAELAKRNAAEIEELKERLRLIAHKNELLIEDNHRLLVMAGTPPKPESHGSDVASVPVGA
jgi:hypothetical protein